MLEGYKLRVMLVRLPGGRGGPVKEHEDSVDEIGSVKRNVLRWFKCRKNMENGWMTEK